MEKITIPQIIEKLSESDTPVVTIDGKEYEVTTAEDGRVVPTRDGSVTLQEALENLNEPSAD